MGMVLLIIPITVLTVMVMVDGGHLTDVTLAEAAVRFLVGLLVLLVAVEVIPNQPEECRSQELLM